MNRRKLLKIIGILEFVASVVVFPKVTKNRKNNKILTGSKTRKTSSCM